MALTYAAVIAEWLSKPGVTIAHKKHGGEHWLFVRDGTTTVRVGHGAEFEDAVFSAASEAPAPAVFRGPGALDWRRHG